MVLTIGITSSSKISDAHTTSDVSIIGSMKSTGPRQGSTEHGCNEKLLKQDIIIISEHHALKTRPDKLDHKFFMFLKNNSKYNIILCEPVNEEIDNYINHNTLLITFTCCPNLTKYNNKKIYWLYDLGCTCGYGCEGITKKCQFNTQYKYMKDQNFDKVWYKYQTHITNRLSKEEPNKYYKFPHTLFDTDIHKDYQLGKKYDILFYGAIYPESYPFRNRLYHLLNKNKNKFNVLFLPYTKKHPEKMTTWVELYKLISQSWLTISCCSVHEVLVAKYFEIALCGSVVCGDYPSKEDEIYIKDNMVLLSRKMSDEEIINSIENALKCKDKLIEYSKRTKNYISTKYMYQNGLEIFESFVENI